MALSSGDQVDRYVLENQLGEGGQGEVWRARDPLANGASRAIKLVRVGSTGASQLERIRREARQLVQLRHPSLVECFGMFEDLHRELLGIVMEFVDAQPLDELIDDPRFDERTRLHLLNHIAQALAYVHQRDVVHRDVKLENVLVTRGFWTRPDDPATVKLIDFGIAVQALNPNPLTQAGHVIGTPPYLAPELLSPGQWGGGSSAAAPADVFAFGVLAWKLLAGDAVAHPTQLPLRARLEEYAAAYWRAKGGGWPGLPPHAAPGWTTLFERALALHPRDRAQNGLDLLKLMAGLDPNVVVRTAEETAPTPLLGSVAIEQRPTAGFTEPETVNVNETPKPAGRTIPGGPPVILHGPGVAVGAGQTRRTSVTPWIALAAVATAGVVVAIAAIAVVLFQPANEVGPPPPAPTAHSKQAPATPPTPPTCSDCDYPGAHCDDSGRCRLKPGARWAVLPWQVTFKPQPGIIYGGSGGIQPSLCVRKRGAQLWQCADFDDKHGKGGSYSGDDIVFVDAPRIVVTTEELLGDGIDLQVRTWGDPRATRLGARHEQGVVAGKVLFTGGLRFGLSDRSFPSALVKLEYQE